MQQLNGQNVTVNQLNICWCQILIEECTCENEQSLLNDQESSSHIASTITSETLSRNYALDSSAKKTANVMTTKMLTTT